MKNSKEAIFRDCAYKILFRLNCSRGLNVTELSFSTRINQPYVSNLVTLLVGEGIILKTKADGRSFLLTLTEKGKKITELIIKIMELIK